MIENMSDVEVATTFQQMADETLHESAVRTAEKERRITLSLLRHLNEIERRHLYSKFNVSSLHGYCVSELKMDEGTAGRRVSAARLLRDLPAIEEKILSGSVTITSVAQAGIFFRKESKNGNAFSLTEKREVIFELENKSTRAVERILLSKSDQPEIHFRETVTVKAGGSTEVRLHFDEEAMTALCRLKEIWSHAVPGGTFADIIKRAAAEAVSKHDPLKKQTSAPKSANAKTRVNETSVPGSTPSKIFKTAATAGESEPTSAQKCAMSRAEIKRQIWRRDDGQCTFREPQTGSRCSAMHFVEEDHIKPKASGGEYSLENIRLRCRAHNQRHAIDCFGAEKMRQHVDSMNL